MVNLKRLHDKLFIILRQLIQKNNVMGYHLIDYRCDSWSYRLFIFNLDFLLGSIFRQVLNRNTKFWIATYSIIIAELEQFL